MDVKDIKIPAPLKKGDKIAICSPAGAVKAEYVEGAVEVLRKQGWEPVVLPHALGKNGNYTVTVLPIKVLVLSFIKLHGLK